MTRGMGTPALIAIVAVIVVGIGAAYFNTRPEGEKMMKQGEEMKEEGVMMKEEGEAMMEKGEVMMEEGKNMTFTNENGEVFEATVDGEIQWTGKSAGSYEAYAPEKLARAEDGDVVLFFNATWCPTCRAANAHIEANRDAIPEGVTILSVDYDTNVALRQKYGVTSQHTFVQVAADGTLIKKWTGSATLAALLGNVQ